jgi:hypothetical protein
MMQDDTHGDQVLADAGTDPRKWRAVDPTSRDFLQRANASRFNWSVQTDEGGTPSVSLREGPVLPEDYAGKREYTLTCGVRWGSGHVLGHRPGEFSSAGMEYATADDHVTLVVCPRVVGLFEMKDELVAVTGGGGLLSRVLHSSVGGALIWLSGKPTPQVSKLELLSSTPYAAAKARDAIWIAGSSGIVLVNGDFVVPVHKKKSDDWRLLFPNSVAVSPDGKIYVGMRFAVAELTPGRDGEAFSELWRVPEVLLRQAPETDNESGTSSGELVTTYHGE